MIAGAEQSGCVRPSLLRHSAWDALLISLALLHGVLLVLVPSIWLIALGLWWNSNTISHNFIHLPFFRSRLLNQVFSAYLSVLLGFPQTLWRARHLAHHAGRQRGQAKWQGQLLVEAILVAALWTTLVAFAPGFFLLTYLPGYLAGFGLCYVQGHHEHARGTTSHYGKLYNFLFFNDGYHVEHHERPGEHWTSLWRRKKPQAQASRWPAVLRWLETAGLDALERLVLRSTRLQEFVLKSHERAVRRLLPRLPSIRTVEIVGGGLFPRTAMVLRRLLPEARIRIIDANAANLATARMFMNGEVEYVHELFKISSAHRPSIDLLVVPLAFIGDRREVYRHPPAPNVLVHDWLWHRQKTGAIISLPLLKRLNLVQR